MKSTFVLFTCCCAILLASETDAQNIATIASSIAEIRKSIQEIVEIGYQNPDLVKILLGISESIKNNCSNLSSQGFPPNQYLVKRVCIVRNDIDIIINALGKTQ